MGFFGPQGEVVPSVRVIERFVLVFGNDFPKSEPMAAVFGPHLCAGGHCVSFEFFLGVPLTRTL